MAYLDEHRAKFENLKSSLSLKNRDHLRRRANGGNSIIFVYPPIEEALYLAKLANLAKDEGYGLINIAELLVKYIDEDGWDDFEQYYKDFKETPHIVFKSDDDSIDLKEMIIQTILEVDQSGLIPILIRTGALIGTGIENTVIVEDTAIMKMKNPLVIFYPSKMENDALLFLNFKHASNYRCTVIK